MQPSARATVIIPTHNHAYTIDLAIESVLNQTIDDLELIILGDGVDDATRAVVDPYWRTDSRIRFMDLPKGPSHGEEYRNAAVQAASAPIVGYLCDDDLFFPEHVEDMCKLLEDHDFAHSLNGYFRPDGSFDPYPADIGDPENIVWHMRPGRNGVSLTGAFHTKEAFARLSRQWHVPEDPAAMIDHAMWREFFAQPWLRAATSHRVTTVQLPSHLDGRVQWSREERRRELEYWAQRVADPSARAQMHEAVIAGFGKYSARVAVDLGVCEDTRDDLARQLAAMTADRDAILAHYSAPSAEEILEVVPEPRRRSWWRRRS
ncbi:MAG: glycosyltransferase family 2 protein [Acidimicrobiia bacterium]